MVERQLPWWFFPISRSVAGASIRGLMRTMPVPPTVLGAAHRVLRVIDPVRGDSRYEFLSPEWVDACRSIRAEYAGRETVAPPAMLVNYVVTEVPGSSVPVLAHTDTRTGTVEFELEHAPGAEVTVTLPYKAARAILVDADATAAMQMFATGKIQVEGDVTKLLALGAMPMDPLALEVAERIRAITI
jgi:hypothetical protein